MKKFLCLLLLLTLVFSSSFSLAEYPLSDKEKNYLGAWNMYADNGKGSIYVFTITFLDSMEVVQNSMTFKDGTLYADNNASGAWTGFTDKSIIFSLANKDMIATIKDDGYLYLYFFDDVKLCGIYSKCEDMSRFLGW